MKFPPKLHALYIWCCLSVWTKIRLFLSALLYFCPCKWSLLAWSFFVTLKRSWKHPWCAQETEQNMQLLRFHIYFGFVHSAKQSCLLNNFKLGFLTSAYIKLCLKQVAFDSVSAVLDSKIWIFQAAKQNSLFWRWLFDCLVKYYTFLMS